jgi:hypothetical protein
MRVGLSIISPLAYRSIDINVHRRPATASLPWRD